MRQNRGKQFEDKVQTQLNALPDVHCERLYDVTSGYARQTTPSDFIVYKYPYMIFLECKSTHDASIPIKNLIQQERIQERLGKKGIYGYFLIWYIDKKKTFLVNSNYVEKMKSAVKSFNYTTLESQAGTKDIILVPAKYPRVFGQYDFEEALNKIESD